MAEPTDDRIDTSSGDSVTVRIAAPPERIYAIVTDIENMGRLSPECTGGRWLAGATGPRVGARFKGTNKRSEEHTSELQSLMRISYAVFCLQKKKPISTK